MVLNDPAGLDPADDDAGEPNSSPTMNTMYREAGGHQLTFGHLLKNLKTQIRQHSLVQVD